MKLKQITSLNIGSIKVAGIFNHKKGIDIKIYLYKINN